MFERHGHDGDHSPRDLGGSLPGADLGETGSSRVTGDDTSHHVHRRSDAGGAQPLGSAKGAAHPTHQDQPTGAATEPAKGHEGAKAAGVAKGTKAAKGTKGNGGAHFSSPKAAAGTHGATGAQARNVTPRGPVVEPAGGTEGDGHHQVGYRPPARNPYVDGRTPIGHVEKGVKPVVAGSRGRRKLDPRTRNRALIALVVVFAIVGGLGLLAWSTRSVQFKLNGSTTNIRVGSSIEQVIQDKGLSPTPGNLVSVSGNVLEEGKGNPYSVKMGDQDLSQEDAAKVRINGGEDLTVGDGTDLMEAYDSTVEEQQPKLVMDGTWGSLGYVSQWGKVGKKEIRTGKQSGETAEGDTIQEVQNCVISERNPVPSDDRKLVALTFDDGPSIYTERYLDILARYGAKATFFELGENIQEMPEVSKKVVEAGHQLASHTNTHQQLTKLGADQLQAELSDTFSLIDETTGTKTTVMRPPYGDFTERAWLNSGGLMSVSVLWTQDSEDWRRPGVDTIVSNSLKGITSGSIILMHDGGGNRDQDLDALPRIIEQLQADGYELVTVDELMASDPSIPQDIAGGDGTLPSDCIWPTEIGD